MKFLLSGGGQKWSSGITKYFNSEPSAHYGLLEVVDFEKKEIKTINKLKPNKEYLNKDKPDIRYTSCSLQGSKLYVGSTTEVFVFDFPSMDLIRTFSHPYLNDVHHVKEINDDIYVVSTGLDAVLKFDKDLNFCKAINVMGKNPNHRFSKTEDLRVLYTTKPHESHPNFIFNIDDDIYVTRFHQKDALCINNINKIFDIGIQKIHDGHLFDDEVFFTTIDGKVIIFDAETRQKKKTLDLNTICNKGKPLGWCRSLAKVDNHIYVGFTKLRSTKVEDNVMWLTTTFLNKGYLSLPTRIAKINIDTMVLEDEFILPKGHMNLIFTITPIDGQHVFN